MKAALEFSLAGKVVLVTGAAGGIGLAAAQALASSGARLMLSDVDPARGALDIGRDVGVAADHGLATLVLDDVADRR